MIIRPPQITASHLSRKAVVYLRQSTAEQVMKNIGSTAVQRGLADQFQAWGWSAECVEILEGDLGVSAATPGRRLTFASVIDRMALGQIGAVGVTDMSRLTRNMLDFARFLTIAVEQNVLLVVGSDVIDFRDPNSELFGMFRGIHARWDGRMRALSLSRDRHKKAEIGIPSTSCPIGYRRSPLGTWEKLDNPRIQEAIEAVFPAFDQCGSCGRAAADLRKRGILLPRRARHGGVVWVKATRRRVYKILRNPAYAGTYIYGRTVCDDTTGTYPNGLRRQKLRPRSEWIIHHNHHPAYVSIERWTAIQQKLTENRRELRVPLGRGPALLQGLLKCGLHHRTFVTQYPTRRKLGGRTIRTAGYYCRAEDDQPFCGGIEATRIERLVEREVLRVVSSPSLATLAEVARQSLYDYEVAQRQRQDELRRAERGVSEAERILAEAGEGLPSARRILLRRPQEKAQALEELRTSHHLHPLTPPISLTESEIQELHRLAHDVGSLWRHPNITSEQRKSLLRVALRFVVATKGESEWCVEVVWASGSKTLLDTVPLKANARRVTGN